MDVRVGVGIGVWGAVDGYPAAPGNTALMEKDGAAWRALAETAGGAASRGRERDVPGGVRLMFRPGYEAGVAVAVDFIAHAALPARG